MKIVCDACGAKYSIADEKVRGKTFKIRCKKCSNVIVVRDNMDADDDEGHEHQAENREMRVFSYDEGEAGAAEEAAWHLVIDQEQVGPMTDAEVRQRFARGEVDLETYTWREGFTDWLPLGSIDQFTDLQSRGAGAGAAAAGGVAAAGAGAAAMAGDDGPTMQAKSSDLFGGQDAGGSDGGDLFGAAAGSSSSGGGDLFGDADRAGIGGSSESDRRLRGERNENSVLFSLNNLAALASDSPRAAASKSPASVAASAGPSSGPRDEGSGLIDIRSMAQVYLDDKGGKKAASGSDDALPVFSAPSFAAPAVLLPQQPAAANNNKLLYIFGGLSVVALLGIAVIGVLLFTGGDDKPVAAEAVGTQVPGQAGTPGEDNPGAAKAEGTGETPAAKPEGTQPEDKGTAGAAAVKAGSELDKKPETTKPADSGTTRKPTDKPSGSSGSSGSSSSTKPKEEEKKPDKTEEKPAGGGGSDCDEVSCLLSDKPPPCCAKYTGKKSGGSSGGSKSGGGDSDLPESLDRNQIKDGIGTVRGKVTACGSKGKGQVKLSIKVSPSGSVSDVSVKESPDPGLGNCAASAVRGAKFPKTQKGATFTYPFVF